MKSLLFLLILGVLFNACIGKNSVAIKSKTAKATTTTAATKISVASVKLINNQFVLTGTNLDSATTVVIKEGTTTTTLAIESQSATTLTANSLANLTLAAGKVFEFVISNASASSSFTVDFSLCSSTLGGKYLDCTTTPNDKEVLSYDASSGKWKPRAVNGLSYQGTWDATTSFPSATTEGDYYIVSVASGSYSVGDWIVYNGSTFEKVSNSTAITNVFGRTGAISATEGDYVLNKMGDVDFVTATPTTNQVLKFNGTNWVGATLSTVETDPNVKTFAKTTLPTCASGEVLKGDGTSLSCVTGSFTGTASRAVVSDGTGALTSSSVTSTELGYVSGVTSSIQTQLNAKQSAASFVDWSVAGVATLEPSRLNLTTINRAVVTSAGGVPTTSSVSSTEIGYLTGVTSNIQTQFGTFQAFAKTPIPTCGAGEVLKSDGTSFSCVTDSSGSGSFSATPNMAVVTGTAGTLTTSTVTSTELGYVSGVTSAIQTQLNTKATITATAAVTLGSVQTNLIGAIQINPFNTAAGNTGELRFYELAANGTNYTGFKSPDGLAANLIYVLPTAAPGAGYILSSDTSGNLSWVAPVIDAPLTGYSVGSNTALASSDTVLGAFDKVQGQINARQPTAASLSEVAAITDGSGKFIVNDGTNFVGTTIGGDVSINASGTATIGNNKITSAMVPTAAFEFNKIMTGTPDAMYVNTTGDTMTGGLTLSSGTPLVATAAAIGEVTTSSIVGGSGTTSSLTLQTTTGVGTTTADIHFKVGNNGATEAMTILNNGNVGIGVSTPQALLEMSSTTSGFLPPRMNSTQRDAITSPATGLTIFNTTTGFLEVYNGSAWLFAGQSIPTGAVMAFNASSCPTGWTEFTSARGRFLRGIDSTGTNDPDGVRAAGNTQTDAFQGHKHLTNANTSGNTGTGIGGTYTSTTYPNIIWGGSDGTTYPALTATPITDGINGTTRTATETRPKNVAVLYCEYSGGNGASLATGANQIIQGNSSITATDSGSDGAIALVTEGTTQIKIDPTGNVGVGRSDPATTLDVNGPLIRTIAHASGTGVSEVDSGQVPGRTLTFTKTRAATSIRIGWTDTRRALNGGCSWEIKVDGSSCSGTSLIYNQYSANSSDAHTIGHVVGYCDGLSTGSHTITIWASSAPTYSGVDCYTGWNGTLWTLEAEEVN